MTASTALLGEPERLLLKAVTGSGQPAVDAFRRWRATVPFDAIGHAAFRVMPLLLALVKREGLEDPDLQRMKGIERFAWAANTLRLKQLFMALDAIRRAGAPFVLLKGAALLARMPEFAALRATGDYDVLVDLSHMGAARRELEAVGFTMNAFNDLANGLHSNSTGGLSTTLVGSSSEIDIHWRALPDLRNPDLTKRILRFAERGSIHQNEVPIPSLAHQLFMSLARCEPWDKDECLTRILEAYFLLSKGSSAVDWDELQGLIVQYRLEARAAAFFEELAKITSIAIPAKVSRQLRPWSFLLRKEWAMRRIDPSDRTDLQRWFLQYVDQKYARKTANDWALTLREVLLARKNRNGENLEAIWQSISQRTSIESDGRRKFLHGISHPEKWGCWTDGHWAVAIVPLNDEQKNGAPVEIHGHVLNSGRVTRIFMTGGIASEKLEIPPGQTEATLSLPLQSLEMLGGDGLLVLWLPDAVSPKALGTSDDRRKLSFAFLRT